VRNHTLYEDMARIDRIMTIAFAALQVASINSRRGILYISAFTNNHNVASFQGLGRTSTHDVSRRLLHKSTVLQTSHLNSLANENAEDISTPETDESNSHSSYMKKYVVIRKNRQSMAFRNGSPLVFSGSVQSTVQYGDSNPDDVKNHKLEMGSLVGIVVDHENDTDPKKRGSSGRRGKGKKQTTEVKYNQYLVDQSTKVVNAYTMDGDFVSKEDDAQKIHKKISNGKLIGYGFFNPISMYRAFIFCHQTSHPELFKSVKATINEKHGERETTEKVLELVLRSKIKDAIRARMIQNLPSSDTDSYRLVNGEGDGLSGLVVDMLGDVAVIMASAAWCELYKDTITRVITDVLHNEHPLYSKFDEPLGIVWRNTPLRLKQDGYILEETSSESIDVEKEATPVIITENGIKYKTYPYDVSSQKTGFYCDQRENRLNLAKVCEGKKVLDLCCYNGGFSLNAMIHGKASSCIGVDSSPVAIAAANEIKELNGISSGLEFVQMDIAQFMKEAESNGDEYDVIILDPPKLSPSVSQLDRAARKYSSLNRDAMKIINKKNGGLLLTCSCSGAMTQKNGGQFFLETIQGAALPARRRITLLSSNGAASCHTQDPASFPANSYLTAALFSVSPLAE